MANTRKEIPSQYGKVTAVPDQEPNPPDSVPEPSPPLAVNAPAVKEELERILASPHFRNSKRYPALLRFVVERTLEGHAADIKERTIAMDVFGRKAGYDPSLDPVVRISAGEVRKRLAQYYQEPGRESEIRIDLPLGSYQPEFNPPPSFPSPESHVPVRQPTSLTRRIAIPAILIVAALSAVLLFRVWRPPTALEQFWNRSGLSTGRARHWVPKPDLLAFLASL